MRILVDDKGRDVRPLPDTMGELITDLKSAVGSAGRVVCGVEVDGMAIDDREERRISADSVESHATVCVKTAEPRELCLSTLEEVGRHIQPIVDECGRVAGLVDAGREALAFERMVKCIEAWGAILAAVDKVAILMQADLGEIRADDQSLSDGINALVRVLQSLRSAIDAHDMVSVRDAMKYEMPEISGRISRQVAALSVGIASK